MEPQNSMRWPGATFVSGAAVLVLIVSVHVHGQGAPVSDVARLTDDYNQNQVIEPARRLSDLHVWTAKPVEETVQRLKNARIVFVDYDLIRRDFPVFRNKANTVIDRWLIDQVGFVSRPQTQQTVVNTSIPTANQTRKAYRPEGYGRALVYDALNPETGEPMGLLDVKGAGSLAPQQASHGNGLATLGESIREVGFENVVREALVDAGSTARTVAAYAVIDPGFRMVHKDGSSSQAGLVVRQSHSRSEILSGTIDEIRRTFGTYGISDGNNIQAGQGKNAGVWDFGHIVIEDSGGGRQADVAIPFEKWGYDKDAAERKRLADIENKVPDTFFFKSKLDNEWKYAHQLAENLVKGEANRDHVWQHYQEMLRPVREKLREQRQARIQKYWGMLRQSPKIVDDAQFEFMASYLVNDPKLNSSTRAAIFANPRVHSLATKNSQSFLNFFRHASPDDASRLFDTVLKSEGRPNFSMDDLFSLSRLDAKVSEHLERTFLDRIRNFKASDLNENLIEFIFRGDGVNWNSKTLAQTRSLLFNSANRAAVLANPDLRRRVHLDAKLFLELFRSASPAEIPELLDPILHGEILPGFNLRQLIRDLDTDRPAIERLQTAVVDRIGALKNDVLNEKSLLFFGGKLNRGVADAVNAKLASQYGGSRAKAFVALSAVFENPFNTFWGHQLNEPESVALFLDAVKEGALAADGVTDLQRTRVLNATLLMTSGSDADRLLASADEAKVPRSAIRKAFRLNADAIKNGSKSAFSFLAKALGNDLEEDEVVALIENFDARNDQAMEAKIEKAFQKLDNQEKRALASRLVARFMTIPAPWQENLDGLPSKLQYRAIFAHGSMEEKLILMNRFYYESPPIEIFRHGSIKSWLEIPEISKTERNELITRLVSGALKKNPKYNTQILTMIEQEALTADQLLVLDKIVATNPSLATRPEFVSLIKILKDEESQIKSVLSQGGICTHQ